MELLAAIAGLFIVAVLIILPFRIGDIQDRVKAIEGQNREQTQLLAGILRVLRGLPGKSPPSSPSVDQVSAPTEKELSLGGYNP